MIGMRSKIHPIFLFTYFTYDWYDTEKVCMAYMFYISLPFIICIIKSPFQNIPIMTVRYHMYHMEVERKVKHGCYVRALCWLKTFTYP